MNVISHSIAIYFEKAGLIQRDMDNTFLDLPMADEDSLLPLQAASVNYTTLVLLGLSPTHEAQKHTIS